MKIGIITNHADRRLESDLQTWAIHKTLDAYGTMPYVIHYHPWNGIQKEEVITKGLFKKQVITKEPIQEPSSFIHTHVNLLGNAVTLEELYKEDYVLDRYFSILDKEYNKTGEENDAYLLKFVKHGAKKMAYGWYLGGEKAKGNFDDFESLSVQKGGEHTFQKEVSIVNDPLIWIKRKDIERIKDKLPKTKPYLFVDVERKEDSICEFVQKVAKNQQLEIKDIENERNDVTYYLGVAAGATRIVTDSIVGILVAILYEKPFVYLNTGNHKDRILSFLKSMKLLYHVEENWEQEPDEKRFVVREKKGVLNRRIIALRRKSLYDLEETLKITTNEQKVECPISIKRGECYGCFACESVCPEHAIEMQVDKEGFAYPKVDERLCTNCGKCEETCIRKKDMNVMEENYPLFYAVKNRDIETRMKSTSGGVFLELAKEMIENQQGVVVGARYDKNMCVVVDIADTMEEAERFCGIKYSKAQLQGIFVQVKRMLDGGRNILYTGLPCECAGLRSYLGKEYENLFIQEVFCHSAPSPVVFQKYMQYLEKRFHSRVTNFGCRDKRNGWEEKEYSVSIQFENGKELVVNGRRNNYIRAYMNSYLDRPSCSKCAFVKEYRAGDLTVGDFYGVQEMLPQFSDGKGVSIVMINTEKGKKMWEQIQKNFDIEPITLEQGFHKNHKKASPYRNERAELFNQIDKEQINVLLESYNDLKK